MDKKNKYSDEKTIIKKARHYKYFATLIAGNNFLNFMDGLVALKKYDVQTRGKLLSTGYKNFFKSGDILQHAKMEAYQNHYEEFMHGNERDEIAYSEILSNCIDNKNYLYVVSLIKSLDNLISQGLDIEKLPDINKQFIKTTFKLKDDCGLDDSFHYEEFYTDRGLRNATSQKIRYFIKDVEQLRNNEEQETL